MSVGLIAAIVFGAVVLGVVLGLVWWVNRPIATDRAYSRQTLPLFSSDRFIDVALVEDEEEEGDNSPVTRDVAAGKSKTAAPTAPTNAEEVSSSSTAAAERSPLRFAPPTTSAPVAPAPSRVEAKAIPETPRTFSTGNGSALPSPLPPRSPMHTPARSATPVAAAPREIGGAQGSTFDGQSVRFSIPTDGTLQFLPGRLEITAGGDLGREIRFVRFPGPDGSRVTFGRVEGPLYRHVQLHDATVSRRHATMDLEGNGWTLTNLSTTNPVVLNEKLLGEGERQMLADGDRIEMGEVVFRYRAR